MIARDRLSLLCFLLMWAATSASAQSFQVAEPLPVIQGHLIELRYAIVNPRRQPVVCGPISEDTGRLGVVVTSPAGVVVSSTRGPRWGQYEDLGGEEEFPFGVTQRRIVIGYGEDGKYLFQEPGVYQLQVRLDALTQRSCPIAQSPPVALEVLRPVSPGDVALWNLAQSNHRVGFTLQSGSPPNQTPTAEQITLRDSLSAFLQQFPKHREAPRVRKYLEKPISPWPPRPARTLPPPPAP